MAGYLGYFKTYRQVRERFTWKGLKLDVLRYVRECPVCQQNKQEHTYPAGLLQPLPIPNRKWQCLYVDFITGLLKAQGRDWQQKAWVKWIYLYEYCYNTTHHISIQMTSFLALYGYEVPSFLDLLLSDSRVPSAGDLLQKSQDILKTLKENIAKAQNQQKQYADQKRTKHSFEVGDMVYLMLQLYC
ncbi:uncharacterized protein LOC131061965 [Cryptomeria japonica]|uniref:uncharacterized protein LOC131061965 n=1 Tax=Cryptomeria japonica TaxID=3369 RepID=UPI0025AD77AC|nr:uncharacterized protein LOC131061965 [Cryptomeria japonica]